MNFARLSDDCFWPEEDEAVRRLTTLNGNSGIGKQTADIST